MNIDNIMTPNPIVGSPGWTVRRVLKTMMELRIRHLPIVEEDGLIGVVSERDLRDELVPPLVGMSYEGQAVSEALLEQPISAVMRHQPITARPTTPVTEVIDVMISRKIGAVIVVDSNDAQKPIGIISYIDVLRASRGYFSA